MPKVHLDDLDLFVHDEGKGPCILFLHGFPFDHTLFSSVCTSLSSDFRCLVPDLRGFGQSRPFRFVLDLDNGLPIVTMSQFADDLNELLIKLEIKEKITVCGLSMGGYIAMEFARSHADRLNGLILSNTRTDQDSPEVRQKRYRLADSVATTGMTPIADSMIPILLSQEALEEKPNVVQRLRHMIESQPLEGVAAAARGMAQRLDTTDLLKSFDFPVHCFGADEDRPSPSQTVSEMSQHAEEGYYTEFIGVGHLPPLEVPKLFSEAIYSALKRSAT